MKRTQLICIEGIAGSGKSSTAQIIYYNLIKNGYNIKKYHEFSHPHPIHNFQFRDVESWINDTLNNWKKLVSLVKVTDEIIILDSTLIQNSIEDLILVNTDKEVIFSYISKLENIIDDLNPVLIYFFQDDPIKAIKDIYFQREDEWKNKVVGMFEKAPYCISRNLTGYAGYESFIQYFREISDQIVNKLSLSKISIENSDGKLTSGSQKIWSNYFNIIS